MLLGVNSLPFPSPKTEREIGINAKTMQNNGASMEEIIAYGRKYGVEINE